ncbi:MAG: peptide chain release factor N(5)-glutamine methyltransferase [Pelotomaculum sp.]|uniref:Release factor glutamine methyltransferase n=1 Tax=Pelotomaculum thermopropionicum (strain DSM 13744 / JCM 10971 / SI) TaxID=370438 RepID=A5CYC2_PELTS|nr:peptide chain release factor N(5)-glutamine methyltransferase [Pelotomaculum sp.]BAF61010.1 methylase of polypeptide chain release factors [Pelotomaculum thermopropionicum SI]
MILNDFKKKEILRIDKPDPLRWGRERLREGGIDTPELDAEVLLAYVTGLSRAGLYRKKELVLTEEEEARFIDLVERRLAGEPVAYLTGHKEFMGLDFVVNRSVLIPRPETELMVETALKFLPGAPVIADVGTGSGAVAVSLAFFVKEAVVYATDISREALAVARLNAARHGVEGRVHFCPGDLLEPLTGRVMPGSLDLIAANLPYIATEDLPGLPREVRLFEPPVALDGGPGGLALYRRLIPAAAGFLKQGGIMLMEISPGQWAEMAGLLQPPQWEASLLKDLAGLDRLVLARFGGEAGY